MQAIGERLREARTRSKLEIADVEAAIKIRAKYLRALENEDFELLPGPTFVKTFLRTYAEYLGLDPHLLVEEYRSRFEPHEAEPQPFVPPPSRRERMRRAPRYPSAPPTPAAVGIAVVAIVLVIFVILGLTAGSDKSTTSRQARTDTRPKPLARKPSARPQPPPPINVVLRVAPTAPTYVCVDHGRGTPRTFEGIISAPMTFRGKHLRINLGIDSTRLTVNRRRVAVPQTGQPVGYDFKPSGTTPLSPRQRPCVA